jgi:hypothetical protein
MDDKTFEKEKEKILKNPSKYKCLNTLKAKFDEKARTSDVVNYGETSFEYNDQDVACKDFGWPDVRGDYNTAVRSLASLANGSMLYH